MAAASIVPSPGLSAGLTVGGVIANAAVGAPHKTAAIIGGQSHTFAELDAAGDAVARQLSADGFGRGHVALVLAPTSFAMLAHYVGCARVGVVFAPLNPSLTDEAIDAIATTVDPQLVLVSPEYADIATRIDAPTAWYGLHPPPTEAAAAAPSSVDGRDPHIAFFTSGSTGVPKAALVSHQTSVLRSHPGAQLEPRGSALCPWPLFHMAGWTISLQQWHARAAVVFVDGTDAVTLATAMRSHAIERFNAIPGLWSRLADYMREQPAGLQTLPDLRFADSGTSPTSVQLLDTIVQLAPNAKVRVFYGSSEAGNVASLHHEDLLTKPGSCGRASVLAELALADDGELLVRGPLLFDGYLGDPAATSAALRDGWFHTGDRAEFDADGYLSIVGRVGTIIRSGGESIAPEAVEAALGSHPLITDVAVFGVPDERWGEVVCAAVVASGELTLSDLRAHVGPDGPAPLASFQHPRRLVVLDELPRTNATGQVDRYRLTQLRLPSLSPRIDMTDHQPIAEAPR